MLHKEVLGEGSYGIVYNIEESDTEYALKRNLSDTESSFIGAIRELDILHKLRDHPHIITLNMVVFGDVFTFEPLTGEDRTTQRNDEVHFIFPKAAHDLYDLIYDEEESYINVKKYMIDILLGVDYMHNHRIIHRDLKPGNILIFKGHIAKICDFGLAKPYTRQGDQTPGVVTVTYRAPEIILCDPNYDYKVDVWSLGCIFFELIGKKSLFNEDSEDDGKLLKNILDNIEKPLNAVQFKQWVTNAPHKQFKIRYSSKHRGSYMEQLDLSELGKAAFQSQCGNLDDLCHLLSQMLMFHPSYRYDIKQCLNHRFFDSEREYINHIQEKFKNNDYKEDIIVYPICKEREWMSETVTCIYNNRKDLDWYNHRCLFQAINMFNRYLYAMYADNNELKHDKFNTNLLFMTCIYISIKYFSSIHVIYPFSSIVEEAFLTEECQNKVIQFEGGLLKNCFNYNIYNSTLYEAADELNEKLDDTDIRNLLIMSTQNNHLNGKLPSEVNKYYKLCLKHKPDDLQKPF